MKRIAIATPAGFEEAIGACCHALRNGKLVAYPTESSYALGADATNDDAVQRVHRAKQRADGKQGLPVIIASLADLERHAQPTLTAAFLAKKFMPGPLTIVLDRRAGNDLAPSLGQNGVAFRIPGHAFALALAQRYGNPITATSANPSGQPALFDADAVARAFNHDIDVLADAGALAQRPPSTLVDARGIPRLLREGAVPRDAVARALLELSPNAGLW